MGSENDHQSLNTSNQQQTDNAEEGQDETVNGTGQVTSELETSQSLDTEPPTVTENSSEHDTSNSTLNDVEPDRVNNDTIKVEDKVTQNTDEQLQSVDKHSSKKSLTMDIPQSNHIAQDDAEDQKSSSEEKVVGNGDPTGTMSPKSYSVFKDYLVHPSEMNLPWQPMRSVTQCSCGIAFSFSVRKVIFLSFVCSCLN